MRLLHFTSQSPIAATIHGNLVGLTYLDTAVDMARPCPEPECYQRYHLDRALRTRGHAKQQLEQFENSLPDFMEAEYFQEKIHGLNSHYDEE